MSANTTESKNVSKLRGQFSSYEGTSSAVNDAHRFYDQLTRRDQPYCSDFAPQAWLVSKKFDLLFVCGFAPWILGAIALFVSGGSTQKAIASTEQQLLTFFLVAASFLIGESHQFTSVIRYYSKTFRERRNPYKWHRLPIWVIYFLAGLVALAFFAASFLNFSPFRELFQFLGSVLAMPILFFGSVMIAFFPAFLMQHFCAQAKAVGLTYCSYNKFYLSDLEKLALSVVSWLLVLCGVTTIAFPFISTGSFSDPVPLIEQLFKADAPLHSISIMVTRYSVVFLGIHFIVRGLKSKEWLPAGAALTWLNMSLFTLVSTSWILYVWLFVPVFFHASQHWTIAWSTVQKESRRGRSNELAHANNSTAQRDDDSRRFYSDFRNFVLPVQILSVVVLFGTLISQHIMFGKTLSTGVDLTLGALLSILVFYCHYFTDRIVWKPTN